jgi:hypothetical protein
LRKAGVALIPVNLNTKSGREINQVDGEVVTAPVVMEALSEAAVVNGYITREEAERIVAGITIR